MNTGGKSASSKQKARLISSAWSAAASHWFWSGWCFDERWLLFTLCFNVDAFSCARVVLCNMFGWQHCIFLITHKHTLTPTFQTQTTLRVHTGSAPTVLSSFHWRAGWSCRSAPSRSFSEASGEESAPPPAAVTSAFPVTTPPAWSSGGRERSRARRTTALTRGDSG